jgi:hypothetical protein
MTKQKTVKKSRLVLIIVIGILLIAGLLVYRHYKYKFADAKIQGMVDGKNKGLYSIQYDNLLLDEVNGTLRVDNVRLTPDTAFYRKMRDEHKEPPVLITMNLPALNITGIKTPKALLNKEIAGAKIEIKHPTIEIGIGDLLKDTTEYSPAKEIYKQILGELKSIQIDRYGGPEVLIRRDIAVPQPAIASMRRAFSRTSVKDASRPDLRWSQQIEREITSASVTLNAVLDERPMRLGEISHFQVGQLLELKATARTLVHLECDGERMVVCQFGKSNDVYTLRVDGFVDRQQEFMNDILSG